MAASIASPLCMRSKMVLSPTRRLLAEAQWLPASLTTIAMRAGALAVSKATDDNHMRTFTLHLATSSFTMCSVLFIPYLMHMQAGAVRCALPVEHAGNPVAVHMSAQSGQSH